MEKGTLEVCLKEQGGVGEGWAGCHLRNWGVLRKATRE